MIRVGKRDHHPPIARFAQRAGKAVVGPIFFDVADHAVGRRPDEAILCGYVVLSIQRPPAAAIDPSRRASIGGCAVVPQRAAHHIVAIAQFHHAVAKIGVRLRINQASSRGKHAIDAEHRFSLRSRLRIAHISGAVVQHYFARTAQIVVGLGADQAVERRDNAANAFRAIAPRHGADIGRLFLVPIGAAHDVVAIG